MKGLCNRRKHVAGWTTMGLRFLTYANLVLKYLNLFRTAEMEWRAGFQGANRPPPLSAECQIFRGYLGDKASSAQQELSSLSIAVTQALEEGEMTVKQRHKVLQTYWAFRRLQARPRSEWNHLVIQVI